MFRFCHKFHQRRKSQFYLPIPEAPLQKRYGDVPLLEVCFPAVQHKFLQQLVGTSCHMAASRLRSIQCSPSQNTATFCLSAPVTAVLSIPEPRKVPYVTCPQPCRVAAKPSCNTCVCAHCLESNGEWPSCWMKAAFINTKHIYTPTSLHLHLCFCVCAHGHGYFQEVYPTSVSHEQEALRHSSTQKNIWQMLLPSSRAQHSPNQEQK